MTAVADEHNPDLDVDAASVLAWSAVHSLAMLHCNTGDGADLAGSVGDDVDLRVEQFTALFMAGFAKR